MAAHRLVLEDVHDQRRLFRCSKCTQVSTTEGFVWSRRNGITCRRCRQTVYVLAERGRSPYQHWPIQEEPPLSTAEVLSLLNDARDDGILFLSLDDLPYYERIRSNRTRRTQGWPSGR